MSDPETPALPLGWVEEKLGTVLPIHYGKALPERARDPGAVPVVGSSGVVGTHSTSLTSGPVLVIGRKGSVGQAHHIKQPCWPIDTAYFATEADGTDLAYFGYLLEFLDLGRLDRSTAVPSLSRDDYNALRARVAPFAEQRRIVAAIEEHLSRVDAGVLALERVKKELARYRASVLKAACEGRLVPTEAALARAEGRSYEPASELLARILAERRARWDRKKKYAEPAPPDTSSLPALPEGWVWGTLDQLGFVRSGNTPAGIAERLKPCGEIPWFRVGDMNTPGNEQSMWVGESFLSIADAGELGLTVFEPRTIIFPKRGGAIATNKKRVLSSPASLDLNTMGFTPIDDPAGFCRTWFQALDLARLSDGSNVPQINHGDVKPLLFPLPPLAEQHRIVAEVERRLSIADEVAATVDSALARAARLRQSILKRAFEGKLVPQDPNDEPASVLLARIRAQREAASAAKPNKKRARS